MFFSHLPPFCAHHCLVEALCDRLQLQCLWLKSTNWFSTCLLPWHTWCCTIYYCTREHVGFGLLGSPEKEEACRKVSRHICMQKTGPEMPNSLCRDWVTTLTSWESSAVVEKVCSVTIHNLTELENKKETLCQDVLCLLPEVHLLNLDFKSAVFVQKECHVFEFQNNLDHFVEICFHFHREAFIVLICQNKPALI